jgi:CBS domain containing-hemolysin-like protein
MTLFLFFILIALSAFFSGAEVAFVSLSQVKIRTFLEEQRRGARALHKLMENRRRMIITILIGNNIVNIGAAALATVFTAEQFGSQAIGIATGILTFLILVFGEIAPKTLASRHAAAIALLLGRIVLVLEYALFPLVVALEWLTNLTHRLVKVDDSHGLSENEIRSMIAFGVESKILEPEEQEIMNRAIRFSDKTVASVMEPFARIFALNGARTLKESVTRIIASGHSRIPVYHERKELITGIVLVKELFKAYAEGEGNKRLSELAKEPLIVQSGMGIDDLMKLFQQKRLHQAMVRDARGAFVGLVTLEDLLEELVGEISDESDLLPASRRISSKSGR